MGDLFIVMGVWLLLVVAQPMAAMGNGDERIANAFVYFLCALSFLMGLGPILLRERPRSYFVHAGGIVIDDGRSKSVIPWEQISKLHSYSDDGSKIGRLIDVIELTDGRRFESHSDDLVDSQAMMTQVNENVGEQLAPQVVKKIDRGDRVFFGPFALDSETLEIGKRKFS